MSEISSCLESMADVEKKAKKLITDVKVKANQRAADGYCFGCFTAIIVCTGAASAGGLGFLFVLILFTLIGSYASMLLDKSNKKQLELELQEAERQAKRMKLEAERNLTQKVREFMNNH